MLERICVLMIMAVIRKSRKEQEDESLPTDHLFSFEVRIVAFLIFSKNVAKKSCNFQITNLSCHNKLFFLLSHR